jgi:ABC-2 type transport system ATP-binding protein
MIQVQNVNFGYTKRSNLFKDLTLGFEPGKIYGLLGKNGTGKTTLIKLMAGLLEPRSGECVAEGKNVFRRLPSVMKDIFVIPEEYYLPAITMEQYVKINAPFYPKYNLEQYNKFVKEFELPANKKLNTLSYGQKKKFLLSFGLASNVRLLFLDEPTNGLDIPSKSQLRKIIAMALNDEMSIVISTHQARDLETLIDSILIIEDGEIVFNRDYNLITEKLSFEKMLTIDDESGILYKEDGIGGYRVVRKSTNKNETHLDLELLFNAVIAKHAEINEHFKN